MGKIFFEDSKLFIREDRIRVHGDLEGMQPADIAYADTHCVAKKHTIAFVSICLRTDVDKQTTL